MDPVGLADLDIPYEESHYLSVVVGRHPSGLAAVAHVEGHLDHDTAPLLRQRLAPYLGHGVKALVFDLARLQFLSSAGVGLLLQARRMQIACGGACYFVHMSPRIRRVFDVMDALPAETVFADDREMDRYLAALQRGEIGEPSEAVASAARLRAKAG